MSILKYLDVSQLEKIDMSDCAGVIIINKDDYTYEQIKDKLIFPYYGVL